MCAYREQPTLFGLCYISMRYSVLCQFKGVIMAVAQGSKPLSTRAIEAMKPGVADKADIGENRGLRVKCGASGIRTFFYRYKSPDTGRLLQIKIGHYPEVTLAQARMRLQELKHVRRQGGCPATEVKRQRQEIESAKAKASLGSTFTLQDLVEVYLVEYIEDKRSASGRVIPGARKRKGQDEVRRTLYGDAVPKLGQRPAAQVTRKEVVDMVMAIVGRGANVQAGNVLRELVAAYEFSLGIGRLPDDCVNPALLAKASLRQAKVRLTSQKGRRVLSDAELQQLLKWLPGSTYTATQKHVIRFTLWTGCRTGEVCNAAWKDVDLDKGTFHIQETKTGVERYVQLSSQAIDFLHVLKQTTGDYLFPSQKTGKPIQQKQLTEQAWRMRQSKTMLDVDPWTPHDLRRTVRTGLSRLQCPSEVAEAVLGHARTGIEGTYDLHKYENECKHWLQKWADHLESMAG